MSNGNKHRRKGQKTSRKRRVPVPQKPPKVHNPKNTYRRININIQDINRLTEE